MDLADSQLIATGHCCEVKGYNTMTIMGCRTQQLLMMAIQITHKQERGMRIVTSSMLVNSQNSDHLGQG